MKQLTAFLALISVVAAMAACTPEAFNNGEAKNDPNELTVTGNATEITHRSVRITAFANLPIELGDAIFGIVCSTNPSPSNENGILVEGTAIDVNNMYSVEVDGLMPNTTYYYASFIRNGRVYQYGEVKSFTTKNFEFTAIDMGLSVKWADCNVGATRPEEYGNYYAWGETDTKSKYNWSTYKWSNGDNNKLTKYCPSDKTDYWDGTGSPDGKTVLDLEDDAARSNWDGSWRMPTDEEWTELRNNCTWTWTTQNGVNGRLVTSDINGNSIFLPAAGGRYGSDFGYVGSYGYYWSSSLNPDYPDLAWSVYFNSDYVFRSSYYRYYGLSVRPVMD